MLRVYPREKKLMREYVRIIEVLVAQGFSLEEAEAEAAREIRMTTGDIYFGRSEEEIAEMDRIDAEFYADLARSAGVTDEFPSGEFAIPGYNC